MSGTSNTFERIAAGRCDLVFDLLAKGQSAQEKDTAGVSLIEWCAYYGDVSAIRHLLAHGASLEPLGANLGLTAASFHGHWRLVEFLLEKGADPNGILPDTLETPLHSALCNTRPEGTLVVKALLAHGADVNRCTAPNVQTGGFMRDCRTRGETPLHRAAAFGDSEAIETLLAAGAKVDAHDARGESPLAWASWQLRPPAVLRLLCYGAFRIHPDYSGLAANLRGRPGP